jgi:hypothetical protein
MRVLAVVLFLGPIFAQQPESTPRRQPPEPKNLKVLKIPASELIPTMRAYSAALGVQCNFCHVQGNFASDEKHEKAVARTMISMAQDLNAKFEDGKVHVTCYTCHRGEAVPKTAPAGAAAGSGL